MSSKTKLVKKNNQNPKSQHDIIDWLLGQTFGKELISTLGSKIEVQNISSMENKPPLTLLTKKSKKKISLPILYFGERINQQPLL